MNYYEYFKTFVSLPATSPKNNEPATNIITPTEPQPSPEPVSDQEILPTKPVDTAPADIRTAVIFAKAPEHIKNTVKKTKSLSLKQIVKPKGTKKNLLKKFPALQRLQ